MFLGGRRCRTSCLKAGDAEICVLEDADTEQSVMRVTELNLLVTMEAEELNLILEQRLEELRLTLQ